MKTFGNLIEMPALQVSGPTAPCRWGAVVTVALPEGTVRHPGVTKRVLYGLERICAIDESVSGIRASFPVRGETIEAAQADRQFATAHLLSILGMPYGAIVEDRLVDHGGDPLEEDPRHGLRLLPGTQ